MVKPQSLTKSYIKEADPMRRRGNRRPTTACLISLMSSDPPPQLQLSIPESNSSTTSFKRSFEQLGLDLEDSASTSSPKRARPRGNEDDDSPPRLPVIDIDVHMSDAGEDDEPESLDALVVESLEPPILPPLSIHRAHFLCTPSRYLISNLFQVIPGTTQPW